MTPTARRTGAGLLLAAAALLGLAGCGQRGHELAALDGPVQRVQHGSGLHVDVPPARVAAELTDSGIRLRPATAAQLRRPWTLDIRYVAGAPPRADTVRDWTAAGGRTLHQGPVQIADGGSGGELHTVDAWFDCGAGRVTARLRQQVERADELDLAAAWQLVLSAGCPGAASAPR